MIILSKVGTYKGTRKQALKKVMEKITREYGDSNQ